MVFTDRRNVLARLKRLDCCREHQLGDTEGAFLFDLADLDQVAAVMKPRRRRQMTDAQRTAAVERLKTYRKRLNEPLSEGGARV